jgi:glucose-6-phosphate 1-dehydrogenase
MTTTATTAGPTHPAAAPRPADPCAMVIFGASGDLTKRLLMPAIYNLACERLLPAHFAIVGTALDELSHDAFRERLGRDIRLFTTRDFDERPWEELAARLYYVPGRFDDPGLYRRLADLLAEVDARHGTVGNRLFYLATPPAVFQTISENLGTAGLARPARPAWARLVIEKPFGQDLDSARTLTRALTAVWGEEQIYRIDHYLGKETVQNVLIMRFANGIFEPLWNRNYVDHIQITVAEKVGVEGRGNYYERSGALRDMMQNHLFQMLAYVAMEPPSSFAPDTIRNEKAELLNALHPLLPEDVLAHALRGQYSGGTIDGNLVRGYREEPDVGAESSTETFVALKLHVDNWRWSGVPFYLRCGKRMPVRRTDIAIQFKRAPEVLFRNSPGCQLGANQLILNIQPDQRVELRFEAKVPGPAVALQTVTMHFEYREAFHAARGTGYETLLYDCMIGDATLFSRSDLVETAWRFMTPILDVWRSLPPRDFPNYPAGTWGPPAAHALIERDGRAWHGG